VKGNQLGDAQRDETFAEAPNKQKLYREGQPLLRVRFQLTSCLLLFHHPTLANRNHHFGLKHLDATVHDESVKTELEKPKWKTDQPALASLLVCASVTDGVEDSRHDPASTKHAGSHRELQAGNKKRSNEAGLVLEVVAVKIKSAFVLHDCSSSRSVLLSMGSSP
jgi:hypothetical protein